VTITPAPAQKTLPAGRRQVATVNGFTGGHDMDSFDNRPLEGGENAFTRVRFD